jgi:hypothetical protein
MIRKSLKLLSIALLGLAHASDVTLPPLSSTTNGREVGIIVIQSQSIQSEQYTSLWSATQQKLAASGLRAAITIPQLSSFWLLSDDPTYSNIIKDLAQGYAKLQAAGLNVSNADIYAAGHFKGGAALQSALVNHLESLTFDLKGVVLLGSFWSRSQRTNTANGLPSFPFGSLTVAAELDGVSRITRYMEAYYSQVQQPAKSDLPASQHPVVVSLGTSHSSAFFTGSAADSAIANADFQAEISAQQSQADVANKISLFIRGNQAGDASSQLKADLDTTANFFSPLIAAFEREAFYGFNTPCYIQNVSGCATTIPFMQDTAQPTLGGSAVQLHDNDILYNINSIYPHDHTAQILNDCTGLTGCVLLVNSVADNAYPKISDPDLGDTMTSANAIEAKMISRQRLYTSFGLDGTDFTNLDGNQRCKEINELAYEWALEHASDATLSRFKNIGQPLVMADDYMVNGALYPQWILSTLTLTPLADGSAVNVTSAAIAYQPISILGILGYHNCMLLSPARAMEWIYVDGLRHHFKSQ